MLLRILSRSSPPAIAAYAFLCSMLLGVVAAMIDVGTYAQTEGPNRGKSVGYLQAVNWFWAYTFVWPACCALLAASAAHLFKWPRILLEKGMLEGRNGITREQVRGGAEAIFDRALRTTAPFVWTFSAGGIVYSFWEWWKCAFDPLLRHIPPLGGVYDWSNQHAMSDLLGQKIANAAFSLVAYVGLQGSMTVISANLIGLSVTAALFLWQVSDPDSRVQLVPDTQSRRPQRGFEVFRPAIATLLLTSAATFLMMYLSRLWKVYLYVPTDGSFWNFVGDHLARAPIASIRKLDLAQIFQTEHVDIGSQFVSIGALVVLGSLIALLWFSLQQALIRVRSSLDSQLAEGDLPEGRRNHLLKLQETAATAVGWPLASPSLNTIVFAGAFACAAIIWYQLGLLYIGYLVVAAFRSIVRRAKAPPAERSTDSI